MRLAVNVLVIVHVDGHSQRLQDIVQNFVHAVSHSDNVQMHPVVVHGAQLY